MGCRLEIDADESGKIIGITGNTCKRGSDYALSEFTDPRRTLTTTVRISGAATDTLLPVRTSSPIPKHKLFEAMEAANKLEVSGPVKIGDIVCRDFIESGINLIACKGAE